MCIIGVRQEAGKGPERPYSRWSEMARLGTMKDRRKIGKMFFPLHGLVRQPQRCGHEPISCGFRRYSPTAL